MEKFITLRGVAAPLPMINVDTDKIIPKQFLKTIKRSGLGKNLFDEMRYDDNGDEIPDFVLNKPAYRTARILVTGENFGCGSSREQAATCLVYCGVQAVVAKSFGRIFYRNAINNGLLAISCPVAVHLVESGDTLEIDLERSRIRVVNKEIAFAPLSGTLESILAAGGLIPYLQSRLENG